MAEAGVRGVRSERMVLIVSHGSTIFSALKHFSRCHTAKSSGRFAVGLRCMLISMSRDLLAAKKRRMLKRATQVGQTLRYLLVCMNGHRWTTEVPAFETMAGIEDMSCPDCGAESMREGRLHVTVTDTECATNCREAQDPYHCVCSCGGVNHGRDLGAGKEGTNGSQSSQRSP